jgi:hypothetical protein
VDDKEFKTRPSRLEQIAKVLQKLTPEIRSEAFDLLKGYVTEHPSETRLKRKEEYGPIRYGGSFRRGVLCFIRSRQAGGQRETHCHMVLPRIRRRAVLPGGSSSEG